VLALRPVLRDYAQSLPPDEQHLFAGIVLGSEISGEVNHYFYPNGNAYIDQPSVVRGSRRPGCPDGR
jgi:hypothetical protein